MALVTKSFSDIITFTRASTGTFFNSAGVLTSAGNNVPRFDYNPATLAARGLLIEEQRTNLMLYSEQIDNAAWAILGSVVQNATTAPDGAANADSVTTNGTQAQAFQGAIITSGATITGSVFLKPNGLNDVEIVLLSNNNTTPYARATFNVSTGVISVAVTTANGGTNASASITAINNGWYRCVVTVTYPATTLAGMRINAPGATGGIFLWGAQLEAGAFPTSYIPTTTTALTRSADVASVNTLSPWFNSAAGTIYAEFSIPAATASRSQATFGDGTANERMIISNNTSLTGTAWRIVDGGVDQADINNSGSFANNATVKVAGAYAVNDFATSQNGGTVGTDTSGTLPTVTALYLGSNGAAQYASSHLRRIIYYPRKLSSAELQAITA